MLPPSGQCLEVQCWNAKCNVSKTNFDVAQAFAPAELGERHGEELIRAGKAANPAVAAMALHAPLEFIVRDNLHDLSEKLLVLYSMPTAYGKKRTSEFQIIENHRNAVRL